MTSTRKPTNIVRTDGIRVDGCWGPGKTLTLTETPAKLIRVVDTEGERVEADARREQAQGVGPGESYRGVEVPAELRDGKVVRADGEPWGAGDGRFDDNGRYHVAYEVA